MDKILKKNFTYLFILQNVNYLIPIILLPYLTRTLGAENFGKVAFVQAFITYFTLLTDYGFNTSSTQKVVNTRHNKGALSQVFWSTTVTKSFFALLSLLIVLLLILVVPKLNELAYLIVTASVGIFSTVLFPIWLFQGIEKMGFITWLNVIPRILVLFSTLFFVTQPSDYLLALQIQVGGALIGAIASAVLIRKLRIVGLYRPSLSDIKHYLIDGWHIFISSVATNIYTTTNTVVLGFLASDAAVGIFSAAEKIIRALISLLSSVSQVTFPRINTYFQQSREKAMEFGNKLLTTIASATFLGGIFLFLAAPMIVKLLFGLPQYEETIPILRISSFLPFFALVNGIIAVNILITFNLKKELFQVVATGGIFSLLLIAPAVLLLQAKGVAICALLTEIIITILLINQLKKHQIVLHPIFPWRKID